MTYLELAGGTVALLWLLVGLLWLAAQVQWRAQVWRARSPGGVVRDLAKPRQCD